MARYDLSTPGGRFKANWDFIWGDHAFLRVGFQNAHWIGKDLVRTNQPWPFQLKRWADKGIRTVLNLRGTFPDVAYYALEKDACEQFGLKMVDFKIGSREAPSRQRILGARDLFAQLEYPVLMHCKSGADRAGIMSVLYRHFHLGQPIEIAMTELSLEKLHVKQGKTGVLDYVFTRYLTEGKPAGLSFVEWVESPAYDPVAIKKDFHAQWWGNLITEGVLRRE